MGLSGISTPFEMLSRIIRQIIYALLTRAPLNEGASPYIPFDLHVLGTPPAFVLSQDQTLQLITEYSLKTQILMLVNLVITINCYSVFKDLMYNQTGKVTKIFSDVNNFFPNKNLFPSCLQNFLHKMDTFFNKRGYTLSRYFFPTINMNHQSDP